MKRDLDLVRKILFAMEELETVKFSEKKPPQMENYSPETVLYHMKIMSQAGLLQTDKETIRGYGSAPGYAQTFYSLSWQGHEFLDALRDDTQWNKVKGIMAKAGGFITEIAVEIAKESIRRAAIRILE